MPKINHSAAYQLAEAQKEIAQLRRRNIELEQRKLTLVTRLARYENVEESGVASSRRKELPAGNYLRPTAASLKRALHGGESEKCQHVAIIQGVHYVYEDGVIVSSKVRIDDRSSFREPGFLRNTESSRMKTRAKYDTSCQGTGWDEDDEYISYSAGETLVLWGGPTDEGLKQHEESPSSGGPGDIILEDESESLETRCRLRDNSWLSGPSGQVYVRSNTAYRFLCQAFRLAQETFREAAREHWPQVFESAGLREGPQEVLFGWTELEKTFYIHDTTKFSIKTSRWHDIWDAMLDMVEVRNSVAHFGGRYWNDNETYDRLLANCQRLAVRVYDERRAFKIREIRDKLRKEADRTLQSIERLSWLDALPYARPWEYHHERAFRRARGPADLCGAYEEHVPQGIRRGADIWSWKTSYVTKQ